MAEKDKPEKNLQETDDLDAFAKALLNKKTEMKLFGAAEEKAAEEQEPPVEADREQAEKTMSEALDSLRRSRGQKTIEEEEQALSASIFESDAEDNAALVRSIIAENQREKELEEEKKQNKKRKKSTPKPVKPRKKKKKPAKPEKKEEPAKEAAEKPAKEKKERKPMDPHRRKIILIIAGLCLAAAAAFGVYAWRVLVYNPENLVSEAQQKAYDKLVDYADEYGSGLMSDAEKLEILDLKADYDSLVANQKKQINAYFREQTKSEEYPDGRTFEEIWQEQDELKKAADDQNKPEYQQLAAYLANWNEKSEEDRRQIVNYKDMYNSLSETLRAQIDNTLRDLTGKTFNTLLSEQEEQLRAADVAARQQLQTQIDELNSQLSDAQTYGEDLAAQLQQSQAAGAETGDLQNQIASNDQYMNGLREQLAQLQAQLDALQ